MPTTRDPNGPMADTIRILASQDLPHAEADDPQAGALVDGLASRAGRVVWNGWPTGVAVAPAQMHGGPYPAATVPGATSVGLHAANRFVRPVVLQSVPADLRP